MSGPTLIEKIQGKFISQHGLQALSQYKYTGVDKSLIYHNAINPLAKLLCKALPLSVSANVITLLGLLCSMGAYALIATFSPTYTESAPEWVYFVASALVFAYLMLDAMDGTQARQTNMASPIGELFDHLCDSCSLTLCTLIFAATVRMGPLWSFVSLVIFFVPFYTSHWDDYNTGKLEMGKFGGPTDLLVGLILVLFVTGCFGSHMWVYPVFTVKSFHFLVYHILVIGVGLGSIISFSQYVSHCVSVVRVNPEAHFKVGSWVGMFAQFTAFGYFIGITILWVCLNSQLLLSYPHRFMICIGFVNAYLLARLIVQRVTKESIPYFYTILFALTAVFVVTTVGSHTYETDKYHQTINIWIICGLLIYAFVQWLYFFVNVVRQLSKYMGIPVMTVDKNRANQKGKGKLLFSKKTK